MARTSLDATLLVDRADHHSDLRKSVAALVSDFGRPYFQGKVRTDEKQAELWAALGDAGFLGVHIPEEFGGGGGGLGDLNVVVEEVAAQGCPMLSLVINSICAPMIERFGSAEMKHEWLPALADGSRKMSFAITEPDAGSNTHNVSTTARPDGDGWALSGTKYWTSAIDEADAVLVVARNSDTGSDGRHPLSLFVVPTSTPGIVTQRIDAALQVPEKQFTVFFEDVRLGPESLVGRSGEGLRQVFVGLNPERVAAAALNNGIARFALDQAARYAQDRVVGKTPIGAHQGVAHPLAEAYVQVQMARLMTARAAELYDAGQDAAEAANMAKFAAADASLVALDRAIQVHGGNGLSNEYGLADLWFIARLHKTAPVSREMILNYVAQHSLGLPKSY
ncbi:acyl-CoA dehydrogenase [Geodermatophilus sp. TF02-6]|uniref:acyl-CoA dehydrogenase family protein n=1 Tax=Geodermatophilus sp. TF02-6 TaxID=2250575 RepID=UPI000DE8A4C7|nr:acyl-CoA dehydrogenase family protein [Geodermatophilus sp. TF02-6]RBY79887.1 acyl-CoA dehydrogenase [Geodermatophilus sp. TF02-6]